MRFISIFSHPAPSSPPSPEMMAKMGARVEEGMRAGWLIATEGVHGDGVGLARQLEVGRDLNCRQPLRRSEGSARRLRFDGSARPNFACAAARSIESGTLGIETEGN